MWHPNIRGHSFIWSGACELAKYYNCYKKSKQISVNVHWNICRCRWLTLFHYFLLLWSLLILKLQIFPHTCALILSVPTTPITTTFNIITIMKSCSKQLKFWVFENYAPGLNKYNRQVLSLIHYGKLRIMQLLLKIAIYYLKLPYIQL